MREEAHAVVILDGAVASEPYFEVEDLRFLPSEEGLAYKAAIIRNNAKHWRLVMRGQTVVDGYGHIGAWVVRDGFYAAVLNANLGAGLVGKNFSILVNGRVMPERYGFIRRDIAVPASNKVCFVAARELGTHTYQVYCTGSDVPIMSDFEDVVGPSADPTSDSFYYGGKKAGRFALYRDNARIEGDYDEMQRPVAASTVVAYAARKGSTWSLIVNGATRLSGLESLGEIVISKDGKHIACAADRGAGTQLFLDDRPVSPPLLYVAQLAFSPNGQTLLAVGTVGERSGNTVSDLRYFVLANGARVSPVFSGKVSYAYTDTGLRYAGFDAWDQSIIVNTIELTSLPTVPHAAR